MKKKMSLEKEFYIYKENHKYFIIQMALKILYDEGIYEEEPLLEKYKDLEMDDFEKADLVTDEFYEEYENGNTENYDRLYKVCWNRIKNRIPDNRAYDIPNAV